MGMYYSAAIIVGLHRDDLKDHEHFDEFVDGDLYQAPPYYDGCDQAIFGVIVEQSDDYAATEIIGELDSKIQSAKEAFKAKTGLDGHVFITPIGW